MERRKTVLKMPIKNPCRTAAVVLTLHASQYTSTCCIIIIIIIILNDAEIRVTLSHLKCFKGTLQSYIISVSLPEKRWQTVLSSISGGKQAVTGFPWPKLEGNSRHATQQPETHDHQWWLDVSVVRRVSTSKQTGDDDVLVHQPSTEVSQQGTVAQRHGGNDASEHTNETVFSPKLSTTVVHGEVVWCVLTSLQRTPCVKEGCVHIICARLYVCRLHGGFRARRRMTMRDSSMRCVALLSIDRSPQQLTDYLWLYLSRCLPATISARPLSSLSLSP